MNIDLTLLHSNTVKEIDITNIYNIDKSYFENTDIISLNEVKVEGKKAKSIDAGYVFFLAVISSVAVAMCVHYLQLKSQITTQTKQIAVMESNLSQLKADNDALYNSVLASVDLEYVKNVAMNELGMDYPKQNQIYQFDTAGNSYVRQYRSVPGAE